MMRKLISFAMITGTAYLVLAEVAMTYAEIQPRLPWCWLWQLC